MKRTRLTLSKTEFEERDGKLYHKVLKREVFEEVVPETGSDPKWWSRCEDLKASGFNDAEISELLNKEGYLSKHKKPITTDHIRSRRTNRKNPWWKAKGSK